MDEEILSYDAWVARKRYLNYIVKRNKCESRIVNMKIKYEGFNNEKLKAQFEYLEYIKSSRLRQENAKVEGTSIVEAIARGCHRGSLSDRQS